MFYFDNFYGKKILKSTLIEDIDCFFTTRDFVLTPSNRDDLINEAEKNRKLLEEKLDIESITVMVQKEVGKRFCANPGNKDYGAITVSINYYSTPNIVINVPKENFNPVPEVDSCVVKLDVKKEHIKLKNEKNFFKVIKAAFSQRRKNIGNSLTAIGKSKNEIKEMLEELNIDINSRAENLSIEQYAIIADYIS